MKKANKNRSHSLVSILKIFLNVLVVGGSILCAALYSHASNDGLKAIEFQPSPLTANLTQQIVNRTFQDASGNLWFLTQEGLNRYNGHELENYRYSLTNPGSLSHDNVTSIEQDMRGDLWISTKGGGLNKYDPIRNTFSTITTAGEPDRSLFSDDILAIHADTNRHLWIGYEDAFSRMSIDTNSFIHYIVDGKTRPPIGEISSITEAPNGKIWLASSQGGVLSVNTSDTRPDQFTLKAPEALSRIYATKILFSKEGDLWIASATEGVYIYTPSQNKLINLNHTKSDPLRIISHHIFDIYEDLNSDIWLCTLEGLQRISPSDWKQETYTTASSNFPSNRIYSIYQSEEGKYWAGNVLGLFTGTKSLFEKHDSTNGSLSNDSVNAFAEAPTGTIWVGTDDGLNWKDIDGGDFKWINNFTSPHISDPTVMSLLGEGSDLWVGTFNGGLNRIDLNSGTTFNYRTTNNENSLPANGVTSIIRSRSGPLLVGTYGGGLAILETESDKFTVLQHHTGDQSTLSSNNVIALYEDSLGFLWVGTEDGLNKVDLSTLTVDRIYTERGNAQSISSDMVWAFHEDREGNLWLGTKGGGLNMWSLEKRSRGIPHFEKYSENISLPSSNIYGIKSDKNGELWLSHNKGVTKFSPNSNVARHYGVTDGLQAKEFNMGASFQDSNGAIYFGGNRGFNVIEPTSLPERDSPPNVHISEIKVMNQRLITDRPYDDLKEIFLDYTDRMLTVEFFASDFTNPLLNKYAYKLEGINDSWIISDDARHASFTTLPPGTYTLRLGAASPAGLWNWSGKSLGITVSPPPWKSLWAYLGYSLLGLLLIAYIVYRQRRATIEAIARQRELEEKVRARTTDLEEARHLAEQANQAKSQFLATVSHEVRTPMHGMLGMTELLLRTNLSPQQKSYAETAKTNGQSLLSLINDILDYSKIESGKVEREEIDFNLVQLLEESCYLQAEPALRKGIVLSHSISSDIPTTVKGDPGRIRQIANNLLSNAVKFTESGTISLIAKVDSRPDNAVGFRVAIAVIDTGIGMDAETQDKIFDPFTQADSSTTRKYGGTGLGLSICKNLVEILNGEIQLSSAPERGTTVTFRIPLTASSDAFSSPNKKRMDKVILVSDSESLEDMLRPQLFRLNLNLRRISFSALRSLQDLDEAKTLFVEMNKSENRDDALGKLSNFQNGVALVDLNSTELPSTFSHWRIVPLPSTTEEIRRAVNPLDDPLDSGINHSTVNELHGLRVLVAEDLETNQKLIKEMASLLGLKIDLVSDGFGAVQHWKDNDYDMVFMDCQMPGMDGFTATRLIRDIEGQDLTDEESRTPIIAITAGTTKDEQHHCIDAGMDDFLGKPFLLTDFESKISQHCKRSQTLSSQAVDIQSGFREEISTSRLEIINQSALLNIRYIEEQTGKTILPQVLESFEEQAHRKIQELASTQSDDQVRSIAHAVKSMALNVGAEKVATIASELERKSKDGESCNLDSYIQELDFCLFEYLDAVKSE